MIPLSKRWQHGAAIISVLSCAATVQAESRPAPSYAKAYSYALKCFVVSGADDPQARSRVAYDAAMRLGRLLNFDDARIIDDFHTAIAQESVNILRQPGYKDQMLADCRRLGLTG